MGLPVQLESDASPHRRLVRPAKHPSPVTPPGLWRPKMSVSWQICALLELAAGESSIMDQRI